MFHLLLMMELDALIVTDGCLYVQLHFDMTC